MHPGKAKVGNFQDAIFGDEKVARFEVSMDDAVGMAVGEASQQHSHVSFCMALEQGFGPKHVRKVALHEIENKDDTGSLRQDFMQSNHVGMIQDLQRPYFPQGRIGYCV